jgi:hypothetical protein
MLLTLSSGGFVELSPPPPEPVIPVKRDWPIPEDPGLPASQSAPQESFGAGLLEEEAATPAPASDVPAPKEHAPKEHAPEEHAPEEHTPEEHTPEEHTVESEAGTPATLGTFGALLQAALAKPTSSKSDNVPAVSTVRPQLEGEQEQPYVPQSAFPTPRLAELMLFRSCHPLYGDFLLDHLGLADRAERIQIFESVLEVPGSIQHLVRVPPPEDLPPGPLAVHRIDPELMKRGLITQSELDPNSTEPLLDSFGKPIRQWAVPLGEKLRRLFDSEYPGVQDLRTRSVWIAGDLIAVGGDFHKYVTTRDLTKQEGIVFRHCLRMILLCEEFGQLCPTGLTPQGWKEELSWITEILINSCREVDPESTDKTLEAMAAQADVARDG